MTVDGYDMKVWPRFSPPAGRDGGRGGRVNDYGSRQNSKIADHDDQERWMALADLRDGQRESWMTDRAKQALGTAK